MRAQARAVAQRPDLLDARSQVSHKPLRHEAQFRVYTPSAIRQAATGSTLALQTRSIFPMSVWFKLNTLAVNHDYGTAWTTSLDSNEDQRPSVLCDSPVDYQRALAYD